MSRRPPKRLLWVGSSLDDLSTFPARVKRAFGYALREAQNGGKSPDAKPLKGFGGAGVLEIVEDFDGDAYRAVYTVRYDPVVIVLHAFQKKSRRGRETPRHEVELIRRRLATAEWLYEQWKSARDQGLFHDD